MSVPRLSFCTTCKGRLHHLRRTLPANLVAARDFSGIEFVLLNYDSPDRLDEWVMGELFDAIRDGRIRYFALTNRRQFSINHAKNIAHLLATGRVVCNLDADNFISREFVEETLRLFDSFPNSITYGKNSSTGRIALLRKHFRDLGGYEESLVGWGQADIDLLSRCQALGLERINHTQFDDFIPHGDEERTRFYDQKNKSRSRRKNAARLRSLRADEPLLANVGTAWGVANVISKFDETPHSTAEVNEGNPSNNSCVANGNRGPRRSSPPVDFSTVVSVDENHVEELRISWSTWRVFRPEILHQPLIIICDGQKPEEYWRERLSFLDHANLKIHLWNRRCGGQRETMLSSLVYGPGMWVKTPWYLKLDTDALAVSHDPWILPEWFAADEHGKEPVLIASPWGYTKPAHAIETLDAWANNHPGFEGTSPLNLEFQEGDNLVRHRRITSWCFFGNTNWTKRAARLSKRRLPIPSHDTFLWYVAARLGDRMKRVRMSHHGWKHISRKRRLASERNRVLELESENSGIQYDVANRSIEKRDAVLPDRAATRGVMYLLTGASHAVRLIVSLWSLRRFYDGPIVLFTTRPESHQIGQRCARDARLGIEHRQVEETDSRQKNSSFLAKTEYFRPPPFELNLHLDCDTLVTGEIDELFSIDRENNVVAVQYADWRTTKKKIHDRIAKWLEIDSGRIDPDLFRGTIRKAMEDRPAINAGVFAFHHQSTFLEEWRRWAYTGRDTFICDEIAMQILLAVFPHKILDCRFNCSPVHRPNEKDVRIWHFHGRKHIKSGKARELWLPVYHEVCRENVAGISEWTPCGDRRLASFIESADVELDVGVLES